MRLRVQNVELAGTTRQIELHPGLNAIAGPITTGKTTALRLVRVLLGTSASGLPTEVRTHVPGIRGSLVVGEEAFNVYRPLSPATGGHVEIAGSTEVARLPLSAPDHVSAET